MTFTNLLSAAIKRKKSAISLFGTTLKAHYPQHTSKTEAIDIGRDLMNIIGPDANVLLRGSVGTRELEHVMKHGVLGAPHSNRQGVHFDIAEYVRENNSGVLYSATECPHTASAYTNLSWLPKEGTIFVLGMPAVFTNPRKQLVVNPHMFTRYQERLINSQEPEIKLSCIKNMTLNNSEITIVTGSGKNDHWHPQLKDDVAKVILVKTTGVIGHYLNYQPSVLETINNDSFQKRPFSLEIYFPDHGKEEDMNERAIEYGLIKPGMRLLTLDDAITINNAAELKYLQEITSTETKIISSVPANIPIGDKELISYVKEEMQNNMIISSTNNPLVIA